jgi:hypothetical protein
MNENTKKWIGYGLIVLAILVAGYLGVSYPIPAPPAPVVAPVAMESQSVQGWERDFATGVISYTADGFVGNSYNWHRGERPFDYADVYYVLDVDATINTTTLKVYTSLDDSVWTPYVGKSDAGMTDGSANVATANVATGDLSGTVTLRVQMPYVKFYVDVTNTSPVTPTIKVYLR